MAVTRLARLLDALAAAYGEAPKRWMRDPLELALWENVAYLADDARRAAAFEALRELTGLEPQRIARAKSADLARICRTAGPHAEKRAGRLREIAELALEHGGDLGAVLALPLPRARRELKRLPAVGDPGVDKILLFSGTEPVLSLESNGLRSLLRLGYGREAKSYSTSYRSACAAAAAELPEDTAPRVRAWHLLRRHGQLTCKSARPACASCAVRAGCPSAG